MKTILIPYALNTEQASLSVRLGPHLHCAGAVFIYQKVVSAQDRIRCSRTTSCYNTQVMGLEVGLSPIYQNFSGFKVRRVLYICAVIPPKNLYSDKLTGVITGDV